MAGQQWRCAKRGRLPGVRAVVLAAVVVPLSGCREAEVTTLPPTVSARGKGSRSAPDEPAPPPALPSGVPARPTFPVDATSAGQEAAALRNECFELAEDLLASAPTDAAGWTLLGAVHRYYGDDQGASRLWNRALEIDPRSAEVHRHLGDAASVRNDLGEAERQYRVALEADPDSNSVIGKLADTLLRAGDIKGAIDLLLVFVAGRPRIPEAWCLLGKARFMEGKIEAARKAFQQALEIDPSSRDARRGMGLAIAHLGEAASGPVAFEITQALVDRRDSTRPGRRLVIEDVATPRPCTASVNYWAAYNHARLGNPTRAVMGWQRAIELDPDDNDSRESLANLFADTGRTREAMRIRQDWCEREPANPAAWFGMGKLAFSLGLTDDAIESLRKVVLLAPDRGEGHALLARALAGSDPAGAMEAAKTAADLDPTAAHWSLVGDLLRRDGQSEAALTAYERAMALDPDDPRARKGAEAIKQGK